MTAGTRARPPRAFLPLFLVCVGGLGGCAWNGPASSLSAKSDLARAILGVYAIITWASIAIAAVVITGVVWVLVRYRDRGTGRLPRQTRGHTLLEISWTIAPALVLLVIAIPTIQVVFRTQGTPPPDALEIVVLGRQWWWEYRYPALGVTTANELHVPVGRPVTLRLEGPDVIHSFWVAPIGGKRDIVPGRVNRLTFTPEAAGEFYGQCAEFCGTSHANMRIRMIVETAADFQKWIAGQQAPPPEPSGDAAEGRTVYARSACVGCHTIRGISAGGLGPDLTHFGSRRTLAAGMYPNTVAHLMAWIRNPPAMKPGAKMPALGLNDADVKAIAGYLLSLK